MNKTYKIFLSASLILGFVLISSLAYCQPPDGGGGGQDPDAAIPIDGGIGILAAAGVAYGLTALRKKKTSAE